MASRDVFPATRLVRKARASRPRRSDLSSEPESHHHYHHDAAAMVPRWSLPSDASMPLLEPHRPFDGSLEHELEMELEASDITLRRHEDAAMMRVSEQHNPFSSSKLQPFHEMSDESVEAALALYRSHERQSLDDDPWKLIKEQSDIRVYRHLQRRGKTTTMMAHGMIRGSVAEIMDGLYAETTKEARVLYPLLSSTFLDVSVLHVDTYRTAQHPFQFAGVTWMAMETPSGFGMCKDRDFLCFQKMGTLHDAGGGGGDDVGFLTLLSVDQSEATSTHLLRAAAALPGGADFVRGFLSLTAFFKPLPNGLVALFVRGDFNARGRLAARLADHLFAALVFALGNAAKSGQAKSLAMLLQSISAGQLPTGGLAASSSSSRGTHVSHLLPLLTERDRDRCGVCSKTLWRVLESPEFCRSCWTRTCRHCHVTMPIYCADFHRAHDEDGTAAATAAAVSCLRKKRLRRLPKPCKETFCLKCVCSVLPNGIKMNAKLLQQTAKKKRRIKKHGSGHHHHHGHGSSMVTDPSLLRRGVGRTAASARHVPSSRVSSGGGSRVSKPAGSGAASSSNGREPGKLYVQIPRPHHHHHHHAHRSRATAAAAGHQQHQQAPTHFDDHSSISVLSSVESEKLQRQRLSLTKSSMPKPPPPKAPPKAPAPTAATSAAVSSLTSTQPPPQQPSPSPPPPPSPHHQQSQAKKQPASMLEVLEDFQLSQLTTTMSADLSEHADELLSVASHSFKSYSSGSGTGNGGAIHPSDQLAAARKLQLRVNLTPRKRARRSVSSAASSRNGSSGSPTTSKRTNASSSSTLRQSPQRALQQPPFDDAYYNQALQRYLTRRTSVGLMSTSTMSNDQFESIDKHSAIATARAAAASGGGLLPRKASAGGARDSRKMRILRDLQPSSSRSGSFRDRPMSPPQLSLSSLSSQSSQSSDTIAVSVNHPASKRPKADWAPPAF